MKGGNSIKLTVSVVGTVLLLFGLGLGWAWFLVIPEYYRSNLGWWEIKRDILLAGY